MIQQQQTIHGTVVELSLNGGSTKPLEQEATKAFQIFRNVQSLMGLRDPDSDISRLNRCAHIAPLRVHPWTHSVIAAAIELSEQTQGAVDITTAPKELKWGNHPRHKTFIPLQEAGAWSQIELLPDSHVRFHAPIQIDLEGIAQGYAMDKTIDLLASRGIRQASIRVGEDFRLHGSVLPPGIQEQPPMLLRPAVSTSPAFYVRKRVGVTRVSPVLHPHTGKTLASNTKVSVFAPTCMEAEALTKAVLLAPQAIWTSLLKARNSLALFLTRRGEQVLLPL